MCDSIYHQFQSHHLQPQKVSLSVCHFDLLPIATAEVLGSFALTEPDHGSDSVSLETTAVRDGGQWVINGHKWFTSAPMGDVFLVLERHYDSGYCYSRAKQESPHFQTVEFKLPSTTPGVFDPRTGKVTGVSEVTRQVSAFVSEQTRTGNLAEHSLCERLTLYIYLRHIGFVPQLGQGVVFNGVRYTLDSIKQSLEDKQWQLELSR